MAPPLRVVSGPRAPASLWFWPAAGGTGPPLMAGVPPALVVRLVRALLAPTAAAKVVLPVLLAVRAWLPAVVALTLPLKVMLPAPVVTVTSPASTAALATLNVLSVVVYVPFRVTVV